MKNCFPGLIENLHVYDTPDWTMFKVKSNTNLTGALEEWFIWSYDCYFSSKLPQYKTLARRISTFNFLKGRFAIGVSCFTFGSCIVCRIFEEYLTTRYKKLPEVIAELM